MVGDNPLNDGWGAREANAITFQKLQKVNWERVAPPNYFSKIFVNWEHKNSGKIVLKVNCSF